MPPATAPDLPTTLAYAPSSAPHARTAATSAERLHALDALRALAMFLGVVLHAALGFMTFDVPFTPVMDASRSVVFDIIVFFTHAFRMQAFFVVAGYFAALLLARRPPGPFLWNRALRIGLPLAVGAVTIVPLTVLPFVLAKNRPLDQVPLAAYFAAPAHLWFLVYLSVFCIAAALFAAIAERRSPVGGGLLARAVASPWAVPLMILPTALLNLTMPSWSIETPWQWLPRPASLAYYGFFFATGFALHRAGLVARVGRGWWYLLPLAILVLLPALIYVGTHTKVQFDDAADFNQVLRRRAANIPAILIQAAFTWSMICGLLGLLLRLCNNPRPWVRWLADSSYWVYLLHLPIVYYLQYRLAQWTIPGLPIGPLAAIIKFTIILSVTTALCLITYALLVRPTPLERIIGGSGKKPRSLNDIPATPPAGA